jgi:hypothetical protein
MLYKNQARPALQSPLLPTLGVQRAIRLPTAKISAGGVIVLGGRQPTRVLFLAGAAFLSPAGSQKFFRSRFGGRQGF